MTTIASFRPISAAPHNPRAAESVLSAAQLEKAIAPALDGLEFMSEGDYPVLFAAVANPQNLPLTGPNALKLFAPILEDGIFADVDDVTKELAVEAKPGAPVARSLASTTPDDPKDPASVLDAAKWKAVGMLLEANLTDLSFVRVGPKDENGKLAIDRGLYGELLVGRSQDGKVAGIYYGSVET